MANSKEKTDDDIHAPLVENFKYMREDSHKVAPHFVLSLQEANADTFKKFSAMSYNRLVTHMADVCNVMADAQLQHHKYGKVELDAEHNKRMAEAHRKNKVNEADFKAYGQSLEKVSAKFLDDTFTDDHGKAITEAHNALVEEMNNATERMKKNEETKEALEEKIEDLREAAFSKLKASMEEKIQKLRKGARDADRAR